MSLRIIDCIDLPKYQKDSKSRKQGYLKHLDIHALSAVIDLYAPLTSLCVLEEPGAMPNQGLGSTFRFGHVCGQIHGVLAGHYIPVVPVKPSVWKMALSLSSNKEDSRALASKYFARYEWLWRLKGQNDRAEAALLCVYAKLHLKKMLEFCSS